MSEELVAYCGLYCRDCFGHKGRIAELAKELRHELRTEKMAIMVQGIPFPVFKHYQQAYEVLGSLMRLKCPSGCKKGGGNPFCAIRKCCQKKQLQGCWQCHDMEECQKLTTLECNHGDAHLKNLKKIQKSGISQFLKGKTYWYNKRK